jgi:hypothetical protein
MLLNSCSNIAIEEEKLFSEEGDASRIDNIKELLYGTLTINL